MAPLILPVELWNKSFKIGFKWVNDNGLKNDVPLQIDDVVVTGYARPIETLLNATKGLNIHTGNTQHYYSANDKILASIANIDEDVNCVTATLQQAGNSNELITTDAGVYLRSNKVVKITPATPNKTASYTLTLYYTTAEVANWINPLTVKVMKVEDGIPLTNVLTTAEAAIFTPVVNDQRTTRGFISYTINATGGFSQFMLVSAGAALPVTLLNFTEKANTKTISTNWQTASEVNSKGFYLERSTDNLNFSAITCKNPQAQQAVAALMLTKILM